jgi:hypothetical protein
VIPRSHGATRSQDVQGALFGQLGERFGFRHAFSSMPQQVAFRLFAQATPLFAQATPLFAQATPLFAQATPLFAQAMPSGRASFPRPCAPRYRRRKRHPAVRYSAVRYSAVGYSAMPQRYRTCVLLDSGLLVIESLNVIEIRHPLIPGPHVHGSLPDAHYGVPQSGGNQSGGLIVDTRRWIMSRHTVAPTRLFDQ